MWNYWRRSERQRTEPEHLHSCQREFKVYSDETRAGDGWNSESENKVCLRCLNHFCKQSVVTLVRASTTKTFNCVGICFTWSDNLSLSTTNTNTLTGRKLQWSGSILDQFPQMLSPSVPSAESAGGSCYLLVFVFGVVHSHGISKVCLLISSPGSDVKAQCNISVCSSAAALLIQCYKQLAAHLDRVRDARVRKPFVHLNLLCRQSTAVNLLQPHSRLTFTLSEQQRTDTN